MKEPTESRGDRLTQLYGNLASRMRSDNIAPLDSLTGKALVVSPPRMLSQKPMDTFKVPDPDNQHILTVAPLDIAPDLLRTYVSFQVTNSSPEGTMQFEYVEPATDFVRALGRQYGKNDTPVPRAYVEALGRLTQKARKGREPF